MTKFIVKAVLLTIGYAIGLPMAILGLSGNLLMLIIGLVFCGLPFGIAFYAKGKKNEDEEEVAVYNVNSDGSYYRVGGWKKFVLALLGLIFGVVATPIYIVYCIVKAVQLRPQKKYVAGEGSRGPKEKPLIHCGDAMYQAYSDKLGKCIPELAKSAPILVAESYASKSDMDRFFREFPQNVNEVKVKIPKTSTAVMVALMDDERRKKFWDEFPQNVQATRRKYPRASLDNIIWVLASNKSEKEKTKKLQRLNKIG